jgi:hypothetical protein
VSEAAITITGDGVTIDAGTGDLKLKGGNVGLDASSGYKVSAPKSDDN